MSTAQSRASTALPHAGAIAKLGFLTIILGIGWLFLNLLNPSNQVIGIIGLVWGKAAWQYGINVFLFPVFLIAIGMVLVFFSSIMIKR